MLDLLSQAPVDIFHGTAMSLWRVMEQFVQRQTLFGLAESGTLRRGVVNKIIYFTGTGICVSALSNKVIGPAKID